MAIIEFDVIGPLSGNFDSAVSEFTNPAAGDGALDIANLGDGGDGTLDIGSASVVILIDESNVKTKAEIIQALEAVIAHITTTNFPR